MTTHVVSPPYATNREMTVVFWAAPGCQQWESKWKSTGIIREWKRETEVSDVSVGPQTPQHQLCHTHSHVSLALISSQHAHTHAQSKCRLSDRGWPLLVELEWVQHSWSLLSQVPQVNTVIGQSTNQRPLHDRKKKKDRERECYK